MSWSKLLNLGVSLLKNTMNVGKSAISGVTKSALSPVSTVRNVTAAGNSAILTGTGGYLAWEAIVNDKPVVSTVADVVIGNDNIEEGKKVVDAAVDKVSDIADKATSAVSGMTSNMSTINNTVSGFKSFVSDIFNGNGLNRISDFFNNIGKGNVSGLGLAGLLAAGFLVFGRFGWLGKIAGLLLSMMIIANNSGQSLQNSQLRTVEMPQRETNTGMKR